MRADSYIRIGRFGSGEFRLGVLYQSRKFTPPIGCEGNYYAGCGTRPGPGPGSRDIGYDSKFVMRGTLPSPLANPVPEPSTIALFALGVLGLSLRRKKCA